MEHWHLELGKVFRIRLSGAGPVVLTSSLGGSILSTPVASDDPPPHQREAEKPLAMHIEYDEQKARTPVSCEIG